MALILLAGLKSLPTDVLEAAEADGATSGQRFRIVILPMLLPAVFLALVLRTMDAFRVFDIVFATTNGGPADATDVLMIYGVKQGLQFFNIGFASAIANMMIVCIAVLRVAVHHVDPARRPPGKRAGAMSRRLPTRVIVGERVALIVIVGVFLAPVAWLITTAYKPGRDIFSFPPTFAFTPTLDNFRGVLPLFRPLSPGREQPHHHARLGGRSRC